MDWMSDRLRGLIAQGQQALGKAVVVSSGVIDGEDDGEGVEDDGSQDWEDADEEGFVVPTYSNPRGRGSGLSSSVSMPSRLSSGLGGAVPSSMRTSSSSYSASTSPFQQSSLSSSYHPHSNITTPTPNLHARYSSPSKANFIYSNSHSAYNPHQNQTPIRSPVAPPSSTSAMPIPGAGRRSSLGGSGSLGSDRDVGGSPELRETMERVRRARLGY